MQNKTKIIQKQLQSINKKLNLSFSATMIYKTNIIEANSRKRKKENNRSKKVRRHDENKNKVHL